MAGAVVVEVICDRRQTTMTRGICERCKKKRTCKYVQPEGWVLECDEYEEDTKTGPSAESVEDSRDDAERKQRQR